MNDLERRLKALPKVDLHRHLEGSVRPESALAIAIDGGVNLPTYDLELLRRHIQVGGDTPSFHGFLGKFRLLRELWVSLDAVERVAYEAAADAGDDNVKYLELRYSPRHFARRGNFAIADVCDRVTRGARRAAEERGMGINFIACIGRDFGIEANRESAEYAVSRAGELFVGIDLAGDEINCPAAPFLPFFERAKEKGLGITIHAGEAGAWANVREALELFKAERIGHGVRVVDDAETLELALRSGTTFEICLTSNLHTGAVADLSRHPIKELLHRGALVTLNTDDPAISNMIDLTHEYTAAVTNIGLTLPEIREIILNGASAAFIPPSARLSLRQQLESDFRT